MIADTHIGLPNGKMTSVFTAPSDPHSGPVEAKRDESDQADKVGFLGADVV